VFEYVKGFCYEFVIMEFITGQDISKNPSTRQQFSEFATKAITALNDRGIFHRDIRPENIFVKKNGELMLIDFGWAIVNDNGYDDTKDIESQIALGGEYKLDKLSWNDSFSLNYIYNLLYKEELQLKSSTYDLV
jgi:serine/threonine protein kinase